MGPRYKVLCGERDFGILYRDTLEDACKLRQELIAHYGLNPAKTRLYERQPGGKWLLLYGLKMGVRGGRC